MESQGIILGKKALEKQARKRTGSRKIIYLLVFIFTLHLTPAIYINSTFLEQFTGSDNVGYVYTFASLLTIWGLILTQRALGKLGNFKVFISNLIINVVCLGVLASSLLLEISSLTSAVLITVFIISEISKNITFLNLDIFLEHYSQDNNSGGIRGFFLTALNTAFVLGPFIASKLITTNETIGYVYLWGVLLLVPVLLISYVYMRDFRDSKYDRSDMWKTAKLVYKKKDLYKVFMSNLILRIFYAWSVIYAPIYLHEYIGFSLSDIGIIMSIALLPFVIFEIPLGKVADDILGEKEILTTGFIITSLSTLLIFFVDTNILWIWAVILFMTRIGASMIEIMTETYLFKKIDDDDINVLGLYRAVRPVAYIIGPMIASIVLIFTDMSILFVILSVVVMCGIRYSLTLKDTK